MKRRNLLLALVLLGLFAGAGVLYFHSFETEKPFGIILFTGEGLVSSKIAAARLYQGGADQILTIEKLPNLALLSNHANDLAVSDAAAAASALATGQKVNQRALAMDPTGRPLVSLIELAQRKGRAVGLITTGSLTDPTPAAFYAHTSDARSRPANAAQLIDRAGLNLIFGGGGDDFTPELTGGRRHDSRDLIKEAVQRGYSLVRTPGELDALPAWQNSKILGLFNGGAMAYRDQIRENAPQLALSEMVRRAVEILQRDRGGYLLIVDAGLIGRASEKNQAERALQEIIELDHAIGVALEYAGGDKTLIVAAGTVATGGLALNGYPLRDDYGIALVGVNVYGIPTLTWATGPNGPSAWHPESAAVPPAASEGQSDSASSSPQSTEPAAFGSTTAANNADEVIAAGFGLGSERLRGFLDNTFIFELIKEEL